MYTLHVSYDSGYSQPISLQPGLDLPTFTARCYTERGITTADRPSVGLPVRLWCWGIMVT